MSYIEEMAIAASGSQQMRREEQHTQYLIQQELSEMNRHLSRLTQPNIPSYTPRTEPRKATVVYDDPDQPNHFEKYESQLAAMMATPVVLPPTKTAPIKTDPIPSALEVSVVVCVFAALCWVMFFRKCN